MHMSDGKSVSMGIQGNMAVQADVLMEEQHLKWYVLRTVPGYEQEAAELMEKKISRKLWEQCRILKKQQLFRTQGKYLLSRKDLFPGYVFVRTGSPGELAKELARAKRFPQMVGNYRADIVLAARNNCRADIALAARDNCRADFVPVEPEDLHFLENVCGKDLEHEMRLSTVRVDEEGQVQSAVGVLEPYVGRITRQRLRHRYVTAEVPLFSRLAEVLFGIRIDGDPV